MNNSRDDPRCPECGEPIGQTATYCMHCSADLTDERDAADADGDGVWDQSEASPTGTHESATASERDVGDAVTELGQTAGDTIAGAVSTDTDDGQLLDPDGLVDNTLTVIVGILGGIVVGILGTIVFGFVTGSAWAIVFGLVTWLGATAYLVRRRTVQGAVAKSGYAVAIVLLLVPVIALSPVVSVDGGIEGRGGLFLGLLLSVAIPAGIAATIGWIASRFVPEDARGSEG